jgi:hypothetical protein
MSRASFNIARTADNSLLEFTARGTRRSIKLTAPEVEGLIRSLAYARSGMTEAPSMDPEPTDLLMASADITWRVADRAAPGEPVILDLRHPALGWLRIALRPEKAVELARDLTRPTGS